MPLLRQLEFAFRSSIGSAVVGQALRLPESKTATEAVTLQFHARELLRTLGAARIARELRVEWNPRLQTAAGRADYRERLISLNPRLLEHDEEEIERTLRHELAHLLAQFREKSRRRVAPHGPEWRRACCDLGIADEARCHNLPFIARTFPPRFIYRCPHCKAEFPRARRVRRAVACLACCRAHNGGQFDPRFRLQLTSDDGGARAVVPRIMGRDGARPSKLSDAHRAPLQII
jgi:SprT protein